MYKTYSFKGSVCVCVWGGGGINGKKRLILFIFNILTYFFFIIFMAICLFEKMLMWSLFWGWQVFKKVYVLYAHLNVDHFGWPPKQVKQNRAFSCIAVDWTFTLYHSIYIENTALYIDSDGENMPCDYNEYDE